MLRKSVIILFSALLGIGLWWFVTLPSWPLFEAPDAVSVPPEPLYITMIGGKEYIIDSAGTPLSPGMSTPNVLRVLPLTDADELAYLTANFNQLVFLLDNIYRRSDLQLDISNRNNIRVIVNDRLVLKFGQAVDLGQKYQAFVSILADLKPDLPRIQYIDLSSYHTPAVK